MTDTDSDEIQVCQNVEPHSLGNIIKSQAIIKFAAVEVPTEFIRLQSNTDLNLPPSNWLTNSANSYGLHQALYHSSGFASFHMAQMFPDCLGEVDVVSDAENIKKLLKLPYAPKCTISMVVHKVGNTLLIDEFDFQKYLLRQASEDWKWIQTFFLENILSSVSEQDRNFCLKDKSRTALQRKNLLSKFLYHSLQTNAKSKEPSDTSSFSGISVNKFPLLGPILPEADIKENVPDPKSDHVFNRNVVWTFEDIRMLIGTDMPIFGGGTRPCISLRLRDMTKPINVLTGIDYWLDNLMCNVPEVVMCYHLDGIVQKYELIKTEDLPYLENSKFSPHIIRNVAQNILAFLKANATKAGHTYWLFKGKNDDVVKLYDLTTLCKNGNGNGDANRDNPFTVPVAMLLYNLARNMKNSSEKVSARKAGSIKTLLDNCIKLLPKEKYPQIVTSSHYILSDLHIPANTDPKSPNFDNSDLDSDTQSVYDDDDSDSPPESNWDFADDMCETTVVVKNICETLREFNNEGRSKNDRSPSPLVASVEERCRIALQHICDGISCLQYFESNEEKITKEKEAQEREAERRKIIHEELNPNMAKPFQPIPLPYETLKPEAKSANPNVAIPMGWEEKPTKGKKKQKGKKLKELVPETTLTQTVAASAVEGSHLIKRSVISTWNDQLKFLLFEKASLTYATLAEKCFHIENYGQSLRYVYMTFRCQKIVLKYTGSFGSLAATRSTLLARAGDCFFQFSQHWDNIDKYFEEFESNSELDKQILAQLEKDFDKATWDYLPPPVKNVEQLMITSCLCYDAALENADPDTRIDILRRMGNVRNELGVKYMFWAQDEYSKYILTSNEEDDKISQEEIKKPPEEKSKDSKSSDEKKEPVYQTLAKQSYDHLVRGVAAFEEIKDNVNLSFLLCNMGRFMRFRAHIPMQGEDPDDMRLQRKFYNQSFTYYQRALGILGSRKENPELWDLVTWELSTATFNLAKQVQDFMSSDLTTEEAEREVVDLLQKSLKLCDVEHSGSRQVLYAYRSGLIHSRLASFYHSQVRKAAKEDSIKTSLQLSRLHYEKASKILESLKEYKDFFDIQVQRIALQEHLAEVSPGTNQKIKALQHALEICLQSKPMLDSIIRQSAESPVEDLKVILKLFESRLQFILRTLAKMCLTKASGKESKKLANTYKLMYSATLSIKVISDDGVFAEHLSNILEKIIEIDRNQK